MTLLKLLNEQKNNARWTSSKVFICYPYDKICRMRAEGKNISDGELFEIDKLDDDTLALEVKPNQWWTEDGDLCIDFYRNW